MRDALPDVRRQGHAAAGGLTGDTLKCQLKPLDFTPNPDSIAHRLFDEATIEAHLDHLAASQADDGGWTFNGWPGRPSPRASGADRAR